MDLPSREIALHERSTFAIDLDELRSLVRPDLLHVDHAHAHWSLIAAMCAAAVAVLILIT